jgi:hypothetical protein
MIAHIPRYRTVASAAVVSILTAWPAAHSIELSHALTQKDTRTLAKVWFDGHVPEGSKVLIEGGKIAASRLSVPLSDSRGSLDARIAYWSRQEPRQAALLKVKRDVHEGGGYELVLVRVSSIASLETYLGRGVEFFVIRPDTFLGARKAGSGSARLVTDLRGDPRIRLLKRFEAGSDASLGPSIEIYQAPLKKQPEN